MIAFTCTKCGMPFQVQPHHAGQKTKCPRCQAAIVVPPPVPVRAAAIQPAPAPAQLSNTAEADIDRLLAEETPAPVVTDTPAQAPRVRPPLKPDPQPWYYGVIRIVAMTQAILTVGYCGIMMLVTLKAISEAHGNASLAIASIAMWAAIGLIGLLIPSAMFLALDMGQQLRAIRQRLDSSENE